MREVWRTWGPRAVLTISMGLTACGERDGTQQAAVRQAAHGEPELQLLEAQARSHAALGPDPREPSLKASFTCAQYEVVRALYMFDWRASQSWRSSDAGTRIGVMRTIRALPIPEPMRARLAAIAPREWLFEAFALRDQVLANVTTTHEEHQRLAKFALVACTPLFERWNACLMNPRCAPVPDTEPAPPEPEHPPGDFGPLEAEHAGLSNRYNAPTAANGRLVRMRSKRPSCAYRPRPGSSSSRRRLSGQVPWA
jgi:hypothetical protein